MKLLNAGCGGQRPQGEHWWNIDSLRSQLASGTPERTNLDDEPRYIDHDFLSGPMPFPDDHFDAVVAVHVIEHFDCLQAIAVMRDIRRVLKPRGMLIVSVPDADYFLSVMDRDTKENAVELFGEPIHDAGHESFFTYALLRHDHRQVLTKSSLLCLMIAAGLRLPCTLGNYIPHPGNVFQEVESVLNRRKFSLEMVAIK